MHAVFSRVATKNIIKEPAYGFHTVKGIKEDQG